MFLYNSMLYLLKVVPTTTPGTTLVSSFSQNLRFELNTLNLALGGISLLHKTKYPIASEIRYYD